MPTRTAMIAGGVPAALTLAAGVLLLHGCAGSSTGNAGRVSLDQGRHADVIRILESEIEGGEASWDRHRDLGIAYFQVGSLGQAIGHLETARSLQQGDDETVFYLGSVLERLERPEEALEVYRTRVGEVSIWPLGTGFGRKIKQRTNFLMRSQAVELVRSRIAEEGPAGEYALPSDFLAVVPFAAAGTDELSSPLAAAVAHWLATDLSQVETLTLVERLQMDAILQELQLAKDPDRLDPSTTPRIGRLLGAGRVLGGSVTQMGDREVRIDVTLTDCRSGEILLAENAAGPVDRFFEVEKRLAFAVLAGLGIEPSPLERSRIEHVPTRNLSAALAFGRGLLAERRGEYDEALIAYQEALDRDSGFTLAGLALQELPPSREMEAVEEKAAAGSSPTESDIHQDVEDRLDATDEIVVGDIWVPDPKDAGPWEQGRGIPEPPTPPDLER